MGGRGSSSGFVNARSNQKSSNGLSSKNVTFVNRNEGKTAKEQLVEINGGKPLMYGLRRPSK